MVTWILKLCMRKIDQREDGELIKKKSFEYYYTKVTNWTQIGHF